MLEINKEWLYQKYIEEKLSSIQIGNIAGVYHFTILKLLRSFGIPVRKSGTLKGSKFSKGHREGLSIAHKGIKNFWYGRNRPEETKEKMSEAKSGRNLNKKTIEKLHKAGTEKWKKTSRDERLERMRNAHEGGRSRWRKMTKCERWIHMLPAIRASQKANPSSIEKLVWKVLDAVGIDYKTQVPFDLGHFIADIYIPSKNLILECNGTYWHNYRIFPKQLKRDKDFETYAKNNGYKLIWLWESEIRRNVKDLLSKENVSKECEIFGHYSSN